MDTTLIPFNRALCYATWTALWVVTYGWFGLFGSLALTCALERNIRRTS